MRHDLGAAAESAHRQSTAQDLAQGREIRPDTIEFLRPARSHAKPRHDLVKNQHRTALITDLAQGFQKTRRRSDTVHVPGDGLHNHGGDVVA